MATTEYGVNHPMAVKLWSEKLARDAIGETFVGKFLGESDTSLFQIKKETSKGAGDKITCGLRSLMTGAGVQGDGSLEGLEEAQEIYSDSILINQLRHAVRSNGRMSEQRVPFSVRKNAYDGLKDWFVERIETCAANQLTGNTAQTDTRYTGNNAATAPSTANGVTRLIVGGSHSAEASLTASTTNAISLADLDKAVALAKTQSQRIRPIRYDNKNCYVAFLHPYQIYQLRRDASTAGNFFDIQKANLQGGDKKDNPIITGASFMYNNVIVHEWDYLPTIAGTPATGSATDFRRGVFCGAQSLLFAYGQGNLANKMSWVEERFDYGNQLGVAAGKIFGIKKAVYNSVDYGTIALSGYAPTP